MELVRGAAGQVEDGVFGQQHLVGQGLAALSKGDATAATGAYEQLVERWRAIQLLERCN